MKPGETTWPSASITSRASSRMRPIVTMRPFLTPMSAGYRGSPDPSITIPFLITRSYGISGLAHFLGHLQRGRPNQLPYSASDGEKAKDHESRGYWAREEYKNGA